MDKYLILAKDILDFHESIKPFVAAGLLKEQFEQLTQEEDLLQVTPGTLVYISPAAPGRANYEDLVRGLRLRGAVPQATYTPPHIKEMQEEYAKTSAALIRDVVWDAVEDGLNPGRIVVEQYHKYDAESNRLNVSVGVIHLGDKK